MLTLDTRVVINKDAIRTVNEMKEIDQSQFSESVEDWLNIASIKPLSDIVSKNKLALFSTPQTKQRSRSKEQVASLKTNCTLFSRFYIACQARQSNLDSFFEHENQACPPSITKPLSPHVHHECVILFINTISFTVLYIVMG